MKADFRFLFMIAHAIHLVAFLVAALAAALGADISSCEGFIDLVGDCITQAEQLYAAAMHARRALTS